MAGILFQFGRFQTLVNDNNGYFEIAYHGKKTC